MARKPIGPKGLCAYFVEVEEQDGETFIDKEMSYLIKKCIEDKIFSENQDQIAVCRSDTTHSKIDFTAANWDGLITGIEILSEKKCADGGVGNPINCINNITKALLKKFKEDSYEEKKILYFATLSSYIVDEEETKELAEKLLANDVYMSFVLPNKKDMTEIQLQNSKVLKKVFKQDKYDDICCLSDLTAAKRQILNTITKKLSKPQPWNVPMEITPQIVLNVSGYVCTRKNKIGEMQKVLLKQTEASSATAAKNKPSISINSKVSNQSQQSRETGDGRKTVVVEMAKTVLEKEQVWTEKDGAVVSEEDVGKGYFFGDKIIPYNELENEDGYQSGEKCLKVLAFCFKENINPAFHIGDGITIFYPKKDDGKAQVMFKALLSAMENTKRVAVVRKVYLKNKKVVLGTLVPDPDRQCLVFSELCFGDDVSIPHLPLLIKPEQIPDEDNEGINEKEALIDELITARTIDNLTPMEGPADPAVSILRESVSKKILDTSETNGLEMSERDNLDTFFGSLIVSEDIISRIKESFPLKSNKVENERFAGSNIFRKRRTDEDHTEAGKKPKVEAADEAEANLPMEDENDNDNLDDLLDEL